MKDETVYENEIIEYKDSEGTACIIELYFSSSGIKAFARFKDEIDDTVGYGIDRVDKFKAIDDAISDLIYQYRLYSSN